MATATMEKMQTQILKEEREARKREKAIEQPHQGDVHQGDGMSAQVETFVPVEAARKLIEDGGWGPEDYFLAMIEAIAPQHRLEVAGLFAELAEKGTRDDDPEFEVMFFGYVLDVIIKLAGGPKL